MDDPVVEIRNVIRSVTEPFEATEIGANIEKYYTPDAYLLHPVANLPQSPNSRDQVTGLFKWLRVFTIDQKIEFHSVTFNEDKTQAAIDMTENLRFRHNPFFKSAVLPGRLVVLLDMKKCSDGKYRIWRQHDIVVSDLALSGLASLVPGLATINNFCKSTIAIIAGNLGRYFLVKKWFGP